MNNDYEIKLLIFNIIMSISMTAINTLLSSILLVLSIAFTAFKFYSAYHDHKYKLTQKQLSDE